MYLNKFFLAWIITVISETIVLVILVKKFSKESLNAGLITVASIFANSLTLPYVWFVFPFITLGNYSINLALSEIFAWVIEAIFYKLFLRLSWKKALMFSLLANAVSYALGYFVGRGLF